MEVYKSNTAMYNACCWVDRRVSLVYTAAPHLKYSGPGRTYAASTGGQDILILDIGEG